MATSALANIFQDASFAWDLLECEMAIEMREVVDGRDIAKLLQLYMRGVEKMNSLLDPRQAYFKTKVTNLMGKSNVIKSFNKAPMAKKKKPLQMEAKNEKKTEVETSIQRKAINKQTVNGLMDKKKQIELRLAYGAEEHSPQALKKLLAQQKQKQTKITDKIEGVLKSHEQRLNERIQKRKLKTSTFRSRPEDNVQINTNCTSQAKKDDDQFVPVQKPKVTGFRPYKSLENKLKFRILQENESPKRLRKMTFDLTNSSKNISIF